LSAHDHIGGGWEALDAALVDAVEVRGPDLLDQDETDLGQDLHVM
jgi:hypothetical protein